jgi:ABC-type multidrug transport system fused ATPase/permease subunit
LDRHQQRDMQVTDLATEASESNALSEASVRSLNDDLKELTREARAYAEAELAFQKSRVAYAASASRSIAVYAMVALVLVFFAVMALIVGLLIALAPILTPWGSTAVVTLALLALAVFLLLRIKRRVSVMAKVFSGGTQ